MQSQLNNVRKKLEKIEMKGRGTGGTGEETLIEAELPKYH